MFVRAGFVLVNTRDKNKPNTTGMTINWGESRQGCDKAEFKHLNPKFSFEQDAAGKMKISLPPRKGTKCSWWEEDWLREGRRVYEPAESQFWMVCCCQRHLPLQTPRGGSSHW